MASQSGLGQQGCQFVSISDQAEAEDEASRHTSTADSIASSDSSTGSQCGGHGAFFLGALFGTIAAISDLKDALRDSSGNYDDDDAQDDDAQISTNPLGVWSFYKVMSVASTLMYLLESWLDGREEYGGKRWMFPLVFGLAAFLDLLSCLLDDEDRPWPSFVTGFAAAHLFVLSAFLTIYDNRLYYSLQLTNIAMMAIPVGDALFMAGSVVDLCVSYWENPKSSSMGWVPVAAWSLVSALLWLLDSLVYRLADVEIFENPVTLTMGEEEEHRTETGVPAQILDGTYELVSVQLPHDATSLD
jgi:hypothetical protein